MTAPRVGMVGAGQLARMTLPAAIALDVPFTVLAAGEEDAAVRAGARAVLGSPDSLEALERLAGMVDVVTFDHEVIPSEHLLRLEAGGRVLRPPPSANLLAQDKAEQRVRLSAAGAPVPAFSVVHGIGDLLAFGEERGWPVVVKVARGATTAAACGCSPRRTRPGGCSPRTPPGSARGWRRSWSCSSASSRCWWPAGRGVRPWPTRRWRRSRPTGCSGSRSRRRPCSDALAAEAVALGLRVAALVGSVGILAVEMFVTGDGRLLVNELALRPHNSGHWTIEGAATSQFENHLRGVLDWPLGSVAARAAAVATVNVVGGPDGRDPAGGRWPPRWPCPARTSTCTGRRPARGASSAT